MEILDRKIRFSPEVLFQEVGGEAVLLDLRTERYLGLNETGTRIWLLLTQHADLRRVLEIMLEEYDVEPVQMERDLMDLVAQLEDAGLIATESEGAEED